ncbi:aspartyl protease family protein [Tenacibaculum agarivorans]|uniref:aspartyl protease family protein n=1 Tax=Tenacibaculum agarivorans TaxID=1908389 RepID=UPI000A608CB0|nr:aspartyl protease family protein [Tenacibaculum agarivorans]
MKKGILFIISFIFFNILSAQGKFQFYGKNDVRQKLKFKLINNLIVIPLEINGKELSFILDTGVNKTILFNLTKTDSLALKNIKKIQLTGLGSGQPVDALLSKNNRFKVNNLINNNEDLYVILDDTFNMSHRMGITIHGIIGFDLLNDVIIKIDYRNKELTFYNPQKYKLKKCRKCEEFDLEFYRRKPYIEAYAQLDTVSNEKIKTKLLIDSGGSDALWLFEGTHKVIKTPKKHFKDILGMGISGTVYGNRSKIPEIKLGKYTIEKPTVSFLDTLATVNARKFKTRNGSIGGNILKRFKVWLDYSNRKAIFKKTGSLKEGFYYNMSGLIVVYDGQKLVREVKDGAEIDSYGLSTENRTNNFISFITSYLYSFKPSFKVEDVILNSPGFKVGIEKGDIIKRINGKPSHDYTLDEINGMFSYKPGKNISIEVVRDGMIRKFKFKLEQRI